MLSRARTVASAVVLTAGLVLGGGVSSAAAVEAKAEVHPEWGRTFKKDGVLKYSCRNYYYRYAITPPKGEWALETFLIGPGGVRLAHGAFAIGMDPLADRDKFRFCRPSTRPGTFKIKGLITVQDEFGKNPVSGWLPVTRFQLR
jgi:hypothetical protein